MQRLPSPYRQGFSTDGQFRNPAGTLPLPNPTDMPAGCWFGNRLGVYLKAPAIAVPDAVEEAFWASPIFDLQPQLRGLAPSGVSGNARGNGYNAIPLWGGSGRLHIQIGNLLSSVTSLSNIKLTSSEFAHISDPSKVVQALATSDITSQLTQETDSIVLHYAPIGEGMPVRYWQVKLRFFRTEATAPPSDPPQYFVDAGYY